MKWTARRHSRAGVLVAAATALGMTLAACSSTGGAQKDSDSGVSAGKATTPQIKIAMITHAQQGDTFWDIIRKGASAAAAKDNVKYTYSSDPQSSNQATLIQNAIDQKVDGIAVTDPDTGALGPEIKKAVAAGIPVVMFNAGYADWTSLGALGYFGQDETIAGEAAGKRFASEGAKNVLCVIQAQGQSQLEARCNGVTQGFGGNVEKVYVNGEDLASTQATITAKLQQDPSIDHIMTLGAPIALAAVKAVSDAKSTAKIGTFDTNAALVKAIKAGSVEWAVDQQPYLQGYEAIDSLWLYKNNGDTIGGGAATQTGPAFVDSKNADAVSQYAARGTR